MNIHFLNQDRAFHEQSAFIKAIHQHLLEPALQAKFLLLKNYGRKGSKFLDQHLKICQPGCQIPGKITSFFNALLYQPLQGLL